MESSNTSSQMKNLKTSSRKRCRGLKLSYKKRFSYKKQRLAKQLEQNSYDTETASEHEDTDSASESEEIIMRSSISPHEQTGILNTQEEEMITVEIVKEGSEEHALLDNAVRQSEPSIPTELNENGFQSVTSPSNGRLPQSIQTEFNGNSFQPMTSRNGGLHTQIQESAGSYGEPYVISTRGHEFLDNAAKQSELGISSEFSQNDFQPMTSNNGGFLLQSIPKEFNENIFQPTTFHNGGLLTKTHESAGSYGEPYFIKTNGHGFLDHGSRQSASSTVTEFKESSLQDMSSHNDDLLTQCSRIQKWTESCGEPHFLRNFSDAIRTNSINHKNISFLLFSEFLRSKVIDSFTYSDQTLSWWITHQKMFGERFIRDMRGLPECPNFAAPQRATLKKICPRAMTVIGQRKPGNF